MTKGTRPLSKPLIEEEAVVGGAGAPYVKGVANTDYLSTNTVSLDITGLAEAGDLLLVVAMVRNTVTTPPSGFTLLGSTSTSGSNQSCIVYYKVSDGTETTISITVSVFDRIAMCAAAIGDYTSIGSIVNLANYTAASGFVHYEAFTNNDSVPVLLIDISQCSSASFTAIAALLTLPRTLGTMISEDYGTSTSEANRMLVCATRVDVGHTVPEETKVSAMQAASNPATQSYILIS